MLLGHSGECKRKISDALEKSSKRVYFIGIGGVSMSSLARLLLSRGFSVCGSEIAESKITESLKVDGAEICFRQDGVRLAELSPALVVYTLATDSENGDYKMAKRLGILTLSRAELMGYVISEYKKSFGVSGTHGKTTVTAMLSRIFEKADKNPTAFLGTQSPDGKCEIIGSDELLIYESCEYKGSFLNFSPSHQLLLNLELDHTDYYKSFDEIKTAFLACAKLARDFIFIPYSDGHLMDIGKLSGKRIVTYGESRKADYSYRITKNERGRYSFDCFSSRVYLGEIRLGIHGRHNVDNAMAALVAAYHSGVKFSICKAAIESFSLPGRRGERIGSKYGADVFYDYAHHPNEIKATMDMLSDMGYKKIAVVFRPHTYSRTKSFFKEFAEALSGASLAVITDIYAAREAEIPGVTAECLAEEICRRGCVAMYSSQIEALSLLEEKDFDCIVLMGAGNLDIIKSKILQNQY